MVDCPRRPCPRPRPGCSSPRQRRRLLLHTVRRHARGHVDAGRCDGRIGLQRRLGRRGLAARRRRPDSRAPVPPIRGRHRCPPAHGAAGDEVGAGMRIDNLPSRCRTSASFKDDMGSHRGELQPDILESTGCRRSCSVRPPCSRSPHAPHSPRPCHPLPPCRWCLAKPARPRTTGAALHRRPRRPPRARLSRHRALPTRPGARAKTLPCRRRRSACSSATNWRRSTRACLEARVTGVARLSLQNSLEFTTSNRWHAVQDRGGDAAAQPAAGVPEDQRKPCAACWRPTAARSGALRRRDRRPAVR